MKNVNYSAKVLAEKRLVARDLIFIKGLNQKDAAREVGISEKTMSKWLKKYKCNDSASKAIRKMGGLEIAINEFFDHIEAAEGPVIRGMVKQHWLNYLKSLTGNKA
jgi:predicted transcriptional regulator